MPLDSDIADADSKLHITFYINDRKPYVGVPFVRIIIPGDERSVIDQPVRDDHKRRFPRAWLAHQMELSGQNAEVIGTPLTVWNKDAEDDFNRDQLAEMQAMKFQTVEQIAMASDSQTQRMGLGGLGLREKARQYLSRKNQASQSSEITRTRDELAELKALVAKLTANTAAPKRKPGRPKRIADVVHDDVATGQSGNG